MFKTILYIDISKTNNINDLKKKFSWQERNVSIELVNDYIKLKKIKEIYPIENYFVFLWNNEESYNQFLLDSRYQTIMDKFNSFNISVIWK